MVLCVSCKKDDGKLNGGGTGGGTQTVATVTTNDVTDITQTTAVCGGEVKSENGWAVTERGVCWSTEPNPTPSDNCTVDGDGVGKFTSEITGLEPDTKYYVRAYAKNAAGTGFGAENSFTTQSGGGGTGDHEYVDLGLPSGLLWATCNVGADSPEDYGDYYQWGGVTPVTSTFINVGWDICPGNGGSSSYNSSAIAAWDATHLTNNVLSPEVDAASVAWGNGWRMPTKDEFQELFDNTTCTWTTENGVYGMKFAHKTDSSKYIFLPAAGNRYGTGLHYAGSYGDYWSSSLYTDGPKSAYSMFFISGLVLPQNYGNRYYGFSVRPVRAAR